MKSLIPLMLTFFVFVGCAAPQYRTPRVAVMDFENATSAPEHRGVSVTVSELLTNMMANTNSLYVVDRQDMNRFIGARYRFDNQRLRYDRWKEIGDKLDVDYFVAGAVSSLQNNFIINGRLYSVATGQVVPGTGRQVPVSRVEDIYPAAELLSRFLIGQIERRRPMIPQGMPGQAMQYGMQQPVAQYGAQPQPAVSYNNAAAAPAGYPQYSAPANYAAANGWGQAK